MSTLNERRIGAIIGSCVADAGAQPLHWIYDLNKLDGLLANKKEIEFWSPSQNPFYRIETGRNSCYGDQAYALLQCLVSTKGLNVSSLVEHFHKCFGPGSEYDQHKTSSAAEKSNYPIDGPWRNGSIKQFLKNVEEKSTTTGSASDEQIDGVARLAPIVALYAGRPNMLQKVESATRVTQDNEETVAITLSAARLLEQFILHESIEPRVAIENVIAQLKDHKRANPKTYDVIVAKEILGEVLQQGDINHREAVLGAFAND